MGPNHSDHSLVAIGYVNERGGSPANASEWDYVGEVSDFDEIVNGLDGI
ncbi:hypothetical protein [Halanaeroarchaeum sp. HSR-CO]|nr:hypothetical protein [Halanaeroarchaeum sp. HSR-CO]